MVSLHRATSITATQRMRKIRAHKGGFEGPCSMQSECRGKPETALNGPSGGCFYVTHSSLKRAFIFNINTTPLPTIRAAQLQMICLFCSQQAAKTSASAPWRLIKPLKISTPSPQELPHKPAMQPPPKGDASYIHSYATKVTLLAASTLAQTASIAALSSRRRAFFSFALLDFLWTQDIRKGWMEECVESMVVGMQGRTDEQMRQTIWQRYKTYVRMA